MLPMEKEKGLAADTLQPRAAAEPAEQREERGVHR